MKRRLIKYWTISFIVGLTGILLQSYLFICGCSNSSSGPVNTEGYSLYASKCGACHRLLPPQDHTMDRWRHYVDKYGKKMTQLEKRTVLDYLQQRAADAQNSQQELSH